MKIKDIIKKQTMVIAIAVILVTVSLISVSYALFFKVDKNSTDQVITAGTLTVTISGSNKLNQTEPMSESEGTADTNSFTYTVTNSGNLSASYQLCIVAGQNNEIDLDLIKVYDGTNVETLTSISTSIDVDVSESSGNTDIRDCYVIAEDIVSVDGTKSGSVYVWIDEGSITDEIDGENLDLDLYVEYIVEGTGDQLERVNFF